MVRGSFAAAVAAVVVLAVPAAVAGASARHHVTFGVFTPGEPQHGLARVQQLESGLGRPVRIVEWFQSWGSAYAAPPRAGWLQAVRASGRLPLVTWQPQDPAADPRDQPDYTLASIVRGDHDSYIRLWARTMAAYGHVVYLRPFPEMNGTWHPWGLTVNGNNAAQFVAAWRHVHDLFDAAGASNVRWVFSANVCDAPSRRDNRLELAYPGARYVDVLSVDGYDGTRRTHSFASVFAGVYRRLARLGPQPIWITETASDARRGNQEAWFAQMLGAASSPAFARLRAIVWFDMLKGHDYRIRLTA